MTLVKDDMRAASELVKNLLKQIGTGDNSESNIWLIGQMVDMLTLHKYDPLAY